MDVGCYPVNLPGGCCSASEPDRVAALRWLRRARRATGRSIGQLRFSSGLLAPFDAASPRRTATSARTWTGRPARPGRHPFLPDPTGRRVADVVGAAATPPDRRPVGRPVPRRGRRPHGRDPRWRRAARRPRLQSRYHRDARGRSTAAARAWLDTAASTAGPSGDGMSDGSRPRVAAAGRAASRSAGAADRDRRTRPPAAEEHRDGARHGRSMAAVGSPLVASLVAGRASSSPARGPAPVMPGRRPTIPSGRSPAAGTRPCSTRSGARCRTRRSMPATCSTRPSPCGMRGRPTTRPRPAYFVKEKHTASDVDRGAQRGDQLRGLPGRHAPGSSRRSAPTNRCPSSPTSWTRCAIP